MTTVANSTRKMIRLAGKVSAKAKERMPAVGFTQDELKAAFDKVADPRDWKNPVNSVVPVDFLAVTMLAVEFFTATKAEIRTVFPSGDVLIFAKGYRSGPAGDH